MARAPWTLVGTTHAALPPKVVVTPPVIVSATPVGLAPPVGEGVAPAFGPIPETPLQAASARRQTAAASLRKFQHPCWRKKVASDSRDMVPVLRARSGRPRTSAGGRPGWG